MKLIISILIGLFIAFLIIKFTRLEQYVLAPVVYDRANNFGEDEEKVKLVRAVASAVGTPVSSDRAAQIIASSRSEVVLPAPSPAVVQTIADIQQQATTVPAMRQPQITVDAQQKTTADTTSDSMKMSGGGGGTSVSLSGGGGTSVSLTGGSVAAAAISASTLSPAPVSAPVSFSVPAPVSVPVSFSVPAPVSAPVSFSVPAPVSAPVSVSVPAPTPRRHRKTRKEELLEEIDETLAILKKKRHA